MPERLPRYKYRIEKAQGKDMEELNKEMDKVGVHPRDVINIAIRTIAYSGHRYEAFFVVKTMY